MLIFEYKKESQTGQILFKLVLIFESHSTSVDSTQFGETVTKEALLYPAETTRFCAANYFLEDEYEGGGYGKLSPTGYQPSSKHKRTSESFLKGFRSLLRGNLKVYWGYKEDQASPDSTSYPTPFKLTIWISEQTNYNESNEKGREGNALFLHPSITWLGLRGREMLYFTLFLWRSLFLTPFFLCLFSYRVVSAPRQSLMWLTRWVIRG